MKARCLTFLLLFAVPMAATGEDHGTSTALLKPLERAVAENEKDWQLQNWETSPNLLFLRWFPKEGVEVLSESDRKTRHPYPFLKLFVEIYKSGDWASEELSRRVQRTSMGPPGIIRDLGDEGFFVTGYSSHGESWFGVRTGAILISVDGPSLDITRRFAERIVRAVESELPGTRDAESGLSRPAADRVTTNRLKVMLFKAVAREVPDWQPKELQPYPRKRPDGGQIVAMGWTPRDGFKILSATDGRSPHPRPDVGVEISLYDSGEAAMKDLHEAGRFGASSIGPKGVVKDLGDEAFLWSSSPHGSALIKVRAGRAGIEVAGPSLDVTMRFVELVVREVESELQKTGGSRSP